MTAGWTYNNDTNEGVVWVHGVCENSTTADYVQIRGTKNTSGTSTVYANSFIDAKRL